MKILLIKPNNYEKISFEDPNYLNILFNDLPLEEIEIGKLEEEIPILLKMEDLKYNGASTKMLDIDEKYIYEMIYLTINGDLESKDYNYFATMISPVNEGIFGNVIIIKSQIDYQNNKCHLTNMSKNELHQIIKKRGYHQGIKIEDDNTISMFEYADINYISKILDEDFNLIKKETIVVLKHLIEIYYLDDPYNNKNEIISKFLNKDIYGDVVIVSRKDEYFYDDLDINTWKLIKKIGIKDYQYNDDIDYIYQNKNYLLHHYQ
jgi:hypothetical protein